MIYVAVVQSSTTKVIQLSDAHINTEYEYVFDEDSDNQWIIAADSKQLPVGLTPENGRISGIPEVDGKYQFKIQRQNDPKTTKEFRLDVLPPPPEPVASFEGSFARKNEAYRGVFSVNTGLYNNQISISDGSRLPPGLKFSNETGLLSGTPETSGNYSVTFEVADRFGKDTSRPETVTKTVEIKVLPAKPELQSHTSLIVAEVGEEINYFLSYEGAIEPVRWRLADKPDKQELPKGLNIQGRHITGTPTASGTYKNKLVLADAMGHEKTVDISFEIQPKPLPLEISTTSIPSAIIGSEFNFILTGSGGSGDYIWDISGELPKGLELTKEKNGITGSPTESGRYSIKATLQDKSVDKPTQKTFQFSSLYADESEITIVTNNLPLANEGMAYEFALSAQGGVGEYTWKLDGNLPPGLSFTKDGIINGKVTSPNPNQKWRVNAIVSDKTGRRSEQKEFEFTVVKTTPLEFASKFLHMGYKDVAYKEQVYLVGGKSPYRISNPDNQLSKLGLSINSSGEIGGKPTRVGKWNIALVAKDENQVSIASAYKLQILENPSTSSNKEDILRRLLLMILFPIAVAFSIAVMPLFIINRLVATRNIILIKLNLLRNKG